jgi:transcriptional regulator with XRE-family HTH domain
MKDRIAHIMRSKNLKATEFAALLGIQPSGVSHVLAGRNNPSLEFVKKIKETFPEYNLDWIIFGTGPMTTSEPYKEAFKESQKEAQSDANLFSFGQDTIAEDSPLPSVPLKEEDLIETGIKSIVVLYEDGTFESFSQR